MGADVGPVASVPPSAEAAPPPLDDHALSALERLAGLRDPGVLSESEFAAAKQRVLGL